MVSKNDQSHDHLRELGELRAVLWVLVEDPDTPKAVRVAATRELRAISEAMNAQQPYKAAGDKVQKLTELRLKAVKGGKA